jgi:hypothetical protein
MTRISSKYLFISKKVFPAIWFGSLALFLVPALSSGMYRKEPIVLIVPLVMAVFGFFLMKKLVWDLADEVYDCGDSLLVKNRDVEEDIPLSNVMNVSVSMYMNPSRITLRLVTPGKFGSDVSFSPIRTFSLNPFAKNQVAEDLIVRVDQARSKRTR